MPARMQFEVEMGLKKPEAVREAAPFPESAEAPKVPVKLPQSGS